MPAAIPLAIAGGSVLGGAISAHGAQSAAETQAGAANRAADITQNEFNTITRQEQPFMQSGYGATSALNRLLGIGGSPTASGYGSLLQPFTADTFHQLSPAYQFNLQQGQQGVLNGAETSGSALSGAAQKELMRYNQSYANNAFNDAFNQYQTQQGNIYNRLSNIAQLGQNAAANTGAQGANLAGQTAQSITNAGSAAAAGQVGAANAWSNSASTLGALPFLMKAYNAPPGTQIGM